MGNEEQRDAPDSTLRRYRTAIRNASVHNQPDVRDKWCHSAFISLDRPCKGSSKRRLTLRRSEMDSNKRQEARNGSPISMRELGDYFKTRGPIEEKPIAIERRFHVAAENEPEINCRLERVDHGDGK